ncbi:hypothetical protein VDGE_30673 [Verticillium dahliae]|uniref:Uncharacterized protein n=1 Tax=Verticillium dahliae TaxID=27337 RepID=A0A444RSE0_VERDA|nr:hypothetical protein VDGE_30673 [Verticillium dahliae]
MEVRKTTRPSPHLPGKTPEINVSAQLHHRLDDDRCRTQSVDAVKRRCRGQLFDLVTKKAKLKGGSASPSTLQRLVDNATAALPSWTLNLAHCWANSGAEMHTMVLVRALHTLHLLRIYSMTYKSAALSSPDPSFRLIVTTVSVIQYIQGVDAVMIFETTLTADAAVASR